MVQPETALSTNFADLSRKLESCDETISIVNITGREAADLAASRLRQTDRRFCLRY
jgi:hypothetical protein